MELINYFGGWLEGPSKQTDRTDGEWVQSNFGAKAEQFLVGKNVHFDQCSFKMNVCNKKFAKNHQEVY